ncbi:uncharacterized protein C8A04DRAFT_25286 [Dichotomopilus funicola]|uniref:Uncharacterized protein n=1 Tax=Dichotomopilus funicola TaxID=1934379 RepID=A0AAN6V8B5_9PEZI|nr:hypothetical protein C8A04DRAFT_25286 [Dichotomopilus funicola]
MSPQPHPTLRFPPSPSRLPACRPPTVLFLFLFPFFLGFQVRMSNQGTDSVQCQSGTDPDVVVSHTTSLHMQGGLVPSSLGQIAQRSGLDVGTIATLIR